MAAVVTGREALGSIEQALAQLQTAEADAHRRLDALNRRQTEARAAEMEALRDLAGFRIKTSANDALGLQLGKVAGRVRAILGERSTQRERIEGEIETNRKAIEANRLAREQAASQLAALLEDRRTAETKAASLLDSDPVTGDLRRKAETAGRMAAEALRKAETAEADMGEKRKPYDNDPLFQYLWQRGYGTSAYTGGNVTRLLDGFVARLIGFGDARPNYRMLIEIPPRLRGHAERLKAEATEAAAAIKTPAERAFAAMGGLAVDKAIGEARKAIDTLEQGRLKLEARQQALLEELAHFSEGDDPSLTEAVHLLADSLGAEPVSRLTAEALKTPSPEDEAIVARIAEAKALQTQVQMDMPGIRQELAQIAKRRGEISHVAQDFRRRRYDADGSMFDSPLATTILTELIRGVITGAMYWSQVQGHRHRRDDDDNGSIFPQASDSRWGGGESSGWPGGSSSGNSSGSSSGNDGFRTGGTF